jgi:hypothetical protein
LGGGSTYSGTSGAWASSWYPSATGATSVVGTNGATFYITGVQLEVGSTATPFERRLYGQELINCQRYYYKNKALDAYSAFGVGTLYSSSQVYAQFPFPVAMRTQPTFGYSSIEILAGAVSGAVTSLGSNRSSLTMGAQELTASSLSSSGCGVVRANNSTSAYVEWSAEL